MLPHVVKDRDVHTIALPLILGRPDGDDDVVREKSITSHPLIILANMIGMAMVDR